MPAMQRSWRAVHADLRGAVLIFHLPAESGDGVARMFDAVLVRHGVAHEVVHNKRQHVLELTLADGRDLLMHCRYRISLFLPFSWHPN